MTLIRAYKLVENVIKDLEFIRIKLKQEKNYHEVNIQLVVTSLLEAQTELEDVK